MFSQSYHHSRLRSGGRSWLSSSTVALALATLLTCILGWIGLTVIHRMSNESLEARLNSEVDTCALALESWLDEQRRVAQSWASDEGVQSEIVEFMKSPLARDWNRERVLSSNTLKRLRDRLSPVCKAHGYAGFVVIDREGRQVAALLDEALGISLDARPFETVRRAFGASSVVTLPFVSSIPIPDENGQPQQKATTMLVAAPVNDQESEVIAVLAFRLRTTCASACTTICRPCPSRTSTSGARATRWRC